MKKKIALVSFFLFLLITSFSVAKTDQEKYEEYNRMLQDAQSLYGDTASGMNLLYDELLRRLQRLVIEYGIKIAQNMAGQITQRVIEGTPIGFPGLGGANKPFGGVVKFAYFCTATGNYWIKVAPAKSDLPTDLIYTPGSSILYAFYQVTTPGNHILGTWSGKAECAEWDGPIRRTVMVAESIAMVGTSGGSDSGSIPSGGGTGPVTPPPPPPPPATTTPPPPSEFCNRDTLAGWNFNPGIQNQVGDASASLKNLLYCVCNRLKQANLTGLITSISDNNHIGRLYECRNPATYRQCGSGSTCCYHSRTSCHYGGSHNDNKSYAADLGTKSGALVKSAVSQCGGSLIDEGNHIHIATSDCRGE